MKSYLSVHPWKIVENNFNAEHQLISESIFSLGNGRFGQRGNLKKPIQATLCLEIILQEFTTQTKPELVGGKTDIQNILLRSLTPFLGLIFNGQQMTNS